jgi:protein TonB
MSYWQQQRTPVQSLPGLALVAALHVAVIYALVAGLQTHIVTIFQPPLRVHVITPVEPPLPPPAPLLPSLAPPNTLTVPLPEIAVAPPALPHAVTVPTGRPLAPTVPAAPPVRVEHAFEPAYVVAGSPAPDYPEAYNDSARDGRVVVDCVIETSGVPTQCRVMQARGGPAFAAATLRWLTGPGHPVYRPAVRDGQPRREEHSWVVLFQPPR